MVHLLRQTESPASATSLVLILLSSGDPEDKDGPEQKVQAGHMQTCVAKAAANIHFQQPRFQGLIHLVPSKTPVEHTHTHTTTCMSHRGLALECRSHKFHSNLTVGRLALIAHGAAIELAA